MSVEQEARQAIEMIEKQLQELTQIIGRYARYQDAEVISEKLRRWKQRTVKLVSDTVHPDEGKRLADKHPSGYTPGQPLRNLKEEASIYQAFLVSLKDELDQHPGDVVSPVTVPDAGRAPLGGGPGPDANTVFIIHGHDEANLLRLEKHLGKRWNLTPIVMRGEAGKGRTLIEKFEQEAAPAGFAIALLTPDDLVKAGDTEYGQPRPNVVFELGWFCGRLGRSNVCILMRKGTRIHSDLEGISRIEFTDSVEEKVIEIETELKEAKLLGEPGASS